MPLISTRNRTIATLGLCSVIAMASCVQALDAGQPSSLEDAWDSPPQDARLGAYWWWLNGNVTKVAITRDLAELAGVRLNGKSLGIVWTPPFRVDITGDLIKPSQTTLKSGLFGPVRLLCVR